MRRSIARLITSVALAAAVLGLWSTASAQAQPATYLPWEAGRTYTVIQGNGGGYSHNTPYTRYGWDFGLPQSTPVLAAAPGRVAKASWGYNGGWGNTVVVCYGGGTCSRYGHLSSIAVGAGQSVGQAQFVGRVGSTGNSTGPHLHYQLENGSGISLASRFVEAGVPGQGQRVTSQNRSAPRILRAAVDAQFPMDGNGVVRIAQGDGPKVPIGFNIRNAGNTTWGDVRLVLVSDPPQNLRQATGWETPNQIPGNIQRVNSGESTYVRFLVNPGEQNEPGDYPFRFKLFDRATGEWIGGAEPSFTLRIEPGCYAAKFAGQVEPPLTAPGSVNQFTVTLRNVGTCTWKRGEVNLGTKSDEPFPYANGSWSSQRNRIPMTEETVGPGELAHFTADVAPGSTASASKRKQYLAPVRDGVTWFGTYLGIYIPIAIGDKDHLPFNAADYGAKWLGQTYADGPVSAGYTTRLQVRYRNIGQATLFADGAAPIHLRGIRDRDRQSGFVDASAPEAVGSQGAKLDQPRVDPGQEFSFTLPVKVMSGLNKGSYQEYFQPVAEGITWFGPTDVFWPFTVK